MDKFLLYKTFIFILSYQIINAGILRNKSKENHAVGGKCSSICSSTECAKKATSVIENMDQSVKPCDDFYDFVCGNYIKHQKIADDKIAVQQLQIAHDELNKKLIDIVKADVLPNELEAFKKLKVHYKNCLDEAEIEKVGAIPLLNLLNRLGGWPVLMGDKWKEEYYRWEDVVSVISKEGFYPGFPFGLFIYLDLTNSQNHTLYMSNVNTEAEDGTNYVMFELYKSHLVELSVMLGADREKANLEMKDLVKFEQELSKSKLPKDQLADVSPLENRKKISDLNKEHPELPWLDVINRILSPSNVTVTENEFVQILDPKFISKVGTLIKNTSKRIIANYQIYKVIEQLTDFLPKKFLSFKLSLLEKMLGQEKLPKREEFCLEKLRSYFDVELSSLFVRKSFNHQSKNKIVEMIRLIKEETKASLKKLDWMDDYTLQGALKKLESMKILAAYPDELFDDQIVESFYENLEITAGKFFDDVEKIAYNEKNFNLQLLNKSASEFQWMPDDDSITEANAFYSVANNKISILAGIVQEPYFESQWPDYLNYGGLGYVIGHEITHGFDDTGRKYDYKGNYINWWKNETAADFERKLRCKIDQYNNYTIKQINRKINGKLTVAENIADAGGIKFAYHAYEKLIKRKGAPEECLPNLNYTTKQMFWINAATVWCEKITDRVLKLLMVADSHSRGEARINVVFSNTEEFAKDFECPAGSMMNPTKKCEVW